ncbi:Asp/Glu/hydantoin racemase [Dillenia turbinata]|uniref:Asp/Glu/hydantoin racemase n=1 Tax=Dillenia turbinata TaxID=194707 RepID=A0AAN8USX5_9MAGN
MFDRSMSTLFQTLNIPSHVLGNTSKQRTPWKMRQNPVLAVPPSSILLQADESGNLRESKKAGSGEAVTSKDSGGPLLGQANVVGIIGGLSINCTLKFVKKLAQWSSKHGEDQIPFILCCDPIISKELSNHERNCFPSLHSKSESSRQDCTSLMDNLQQKRIFLEHSGARCIVMPCHISHSWHAYISKGCSVPFLHMGECVSKELKEVKLKPLEAGSPVRIGLLATNATLAAGIYQEKLESKGFEVVLPDKATMEHTVIPATEALNRKDMEGARNLLRIALQVLLVRAVNTIILASDDMRDLLPRDDPLLKKCIDPTDALARSTIKWAQSAE